eukprot:s671_g8.t1
MTLSEAKAKSKCSKCGQIGHWHRDPECPRNQPGGGGGGNSNMKSKEVNFVEKDENPLVIDEAIFCGHVEMLDSRTSGTERSETDTLVSPECDRDGLVSSVAADVQINDHFGSVDPSNFDQMYKDRVQGDGLVNSGCLGDVAFDCNPEMGIPVFWNELSKDQSRRPSPCPDELCATIGTGCQRMAIGLETLRQLDQRLPEGLQSNLIKQEHRFRSVHGTSTTRFAAVIPTSLGIRGSLLRPAIFDTPESREAPFLISLPFLMFCKAVLNLDPSLGLSLELKRFGCTVPCHLGPSGALRVPLGSFTPEMLQKVKQAQHEFQGQVGEFEILRTVDAQAPEPHCANVDPENRAEDVFHRHGSARSGQAVEDDSGCGSRTVDRVAEDGPEDAPDDRTDGAAGRLGQAPGTEAILSIPACGRSPTSGHFVGSARGSGELGKILNGRDGKCPLRCRDPPTADHATTTCGDSHALQPCDVSVTRISDCPDAGRLCDGRGQAAPGISTVMSTWPGESDLHDPKARTELRSPLLEVCSRPPDSVPVLRMDGVPTSLEPDRSSSDAKDGEAISIQSGTEEHKSQLGGGIADGDIGEGFFPSSTTDLQWRRTLPTHPDNQGRDQQVCAHREVPQLPDGAAEGASSVRRRGIGEGQPEQQGGSIEQQGACGRQCGDSHDDGGFHRVPGVPAVEKGEPPLPGEWRSRDLSGSETVEPTESSESFVLNRRCRRILEQARKALKSVSQGWQELMSLLRTDPAQTDCTGWSHFSSECLDPKDPAKMTDRQALQKYLWLLQRTEKQVKTVSEIYNPRRFQGHVDKFGLCQGQAFDLELGHDLLDKKVRDEVRRYIQEIKPGLVVISPPCTLFSLLQNLSAAKRTPENAKIFLRRMTEAKVLLQFGIEIALEVLSYGGTFVFEHPLTSRAWSERMMQKLIQHPEVFMTACDQCRYGLRAQSGLFHRKATGFLSNNEKMQNVEMSADEKLPKERDLSQNMAVVENKDLTADDILAVDEPAIEDAPVPENQVADIPERDVQPLPTERPFSLEQLVRRAHEGLGHPGNERLARILRDAKASEEAVKIGKGLRCSVCERHAATRPARRAAPPKQVHVNQVVGIDAVYLPDYRGKTRMALNIVDWASRFQMMIPLSGHSPGAARRAYLQWVRLFGPPENLYTDLGREFLGAFELGAEHDSTFIDPSALEMPTQRGITERAGRHFKEVLSRTMMQIGCSNHEEWTNVVDIVNMTCNRLMNKSGYSPIQRVLGYSPRVPGGLLTGGANDLATMSRCGGDLQMQRAQEIRLAAAKAFHEADSEQALKNALHGGHRQRRDFEVGQLVYFWRKGTDGPKKNRPGFWRGPCRVILTSPPNVVWVNFRGFIVKAAPEHLRLASEEERFTLTDWINDIAGTREELEKEPKKGYLDLTDHPFPTKEDQDRPVALPDEVEQDPRYRLNRKTHPRDVPFRDDPRPDEWRLDEDNGVLHRIHRQPREERFQPTEAHLDCPVEKERLKSRRRTVGQYVDGGTGFQEEDDWIQAYGQEIPMMPWTGRTSFNLHPPGDEHVSRALCVGRDPHHNPVRDDANVPHSQAEPPSEQVQRSGQVRPFGQVVYETQNVLLVTLLFMMIPEEILRRTENQNGNLPDERKGSRTTGLKEDTHPVLDLPKKKITIEVKFEVEMTRMRKPLRTIDRNE